MPTRVAICIITYRRPELLARLLAALPRLEHTDCDLAVHVVENEAAGPATEVVAALADGAYPLPLTFGREPSSGIPFARNSVLEGARLDSDFVAFIDDDEQPDPVWLKELLRVQAEHGADVVTGPVLPRLPHGSPGWMARGRLFDRPRYPTGTRRDRAFTGNMLLRTALIERFWPPFDETMATSGGSDAEFSGRLHRAGCLIVWADEAIVHEDVPAERAHLGWLVRRRLRTGGNLTRLLLARHAKPVALGHTVLRAGSELVVGAAMMPLGLARREWAAKGLMRWGQAAGRLGGLFGRVYQEYARPATADSEVITTPAGDD